MRVLNAINQAGIKLKKNNIKSPLLDAEVLMSKAINKDRKTIILNLDKELDQSDYL